MSNIAEQTLASIVADYRLVIPVLEKYNIDYSAKGKRTLAEACLEEEIKIENITEELLSFATPALKKKASTKLNAGQLIGHVLIHHHFYVKQSVPRIIAHLNKVVAKQGETFSYMKEVDELFKMLARQLCLHMEKQEVILFQRMKEVENLFRSGKNSEILSCYIQTQIKIMEADHEEASNIMYQIRILTKNYIPPHNAGKTFKIVLSELKEFEENLQEHGHLENNILFPMVYNMKPINLKK